MDLATLRSSRSSNGTDRCAIHGDCTAGSVRGASAVTFGLWSVAIFTVSSRHHEIAAASITKFGTIICSERQMISVCLVKRKHHRASLAVPLNATSDIMADVIAERRTFKPA